MAEGRLSPIRGYGIPEVSATPIYVTQSALPSLGSFEDIGGGTAFFYKSLAGVAESGYSMFETMHEKETEPKSVAEAGAQVDAAQNEANKALGEKGKSMLDTIDDKIKEVYEIGKGAASEMNEYLGLDKIINRLLGNSEGTES